MRAMEHDVGMNFPGSLLDAVVLTRPAGWSLTLVPLSGSSFTKENIPTRRNYTETSVGGSCVRQQLRSEYLGDVLSNEEGCVLS